MEKLSIHLRYGTQTRLLVTTPSEFLPKAAALFHLKEEEIEIYERKKNSTTTTKIDVKDLRDFIRVEISKMQPVSNNGINGQRSSKSMKMSHPVNKTSSNSIVAEMCVKLKEHKSFTMTESELLFGHLMSLPPHLKRRLESGNPQPVEMKNRKIQANPIDPKSAFTQTDKLIDLPRTSTSTNNVNEEIKRHAKKEKRDPVITTELMTKSFEERRNFILISKPMVQFVKEKYPLLFTLSEVRNEMERISYDSKCDEFLTNIAKYADIILSLAKDDDPLLLDIREKEKSYGTTFQKRYAREVGSILMLSSLINEPRNYLKLENTSIKPGNHPFLECEAKMSEIFFDQYTYKVFTENMLICEASDFKEAILCLIANYFIFNISYPEDSFNTFVVMERLYLEANDTEDCNIDEFVLQIIKTLKLKALARQR